MHSATQSPGFWLSPDSGTKRIADTPGCFCRAACAASTSGRSRRITNVNGRMSPSWPAPRPLSSEVVGFACRRGVLWRPTHRVGRLLLGGARASWVQNQAFRRLRPIMDAALEPSRCMPLGRAFRCRAWSESNRPIGRLVRL